MARLWTELDLQACKHCAAKCGCHECGHSSICEHGRPQFVSMINSAVHNLLGAEAIDNSPAAREHDL